MVRTFGGVPFLREYRGIRHALTYWVLKRADVYLAETKAQVTMALSHGIEKVRWFPNSRPMPVPHSPTNPRCTRFVFCSHVKPSKGILEIIEAAEQLNSDVVVDIYGTFHDGMTEEVFQGSQVVKYRGILDPDQVVPTLRQYDALLLPTYFEGEGYPGIIVDAYRAGLPVIATRWQAIPELLDESAGILVEPRSAPALRTAMRRLIDDSNLFRTLRAGAAKAAQRFSLDFWGPRFIELCAALPTHGPLPSDPDSTKRTA
jgi:glycosyltransferase involved in cell wall biosynthesis